MGYSSKEELAYNISKETSFSANQIQAFMSVGLVSAVKTSEGYVGKYDESKLNQYETLTKQQMSNLLGISEAKLDSIINNNAFPLPLANTANGQLFVATPKEIETTKANIDTIWEKALNNEYSASEDMTREFGDREIEYSSGFDNVEIEPESDYGHNTEESVQDNFTDEALPEGKLKKTGSKSYEYESNLMNNDIGTKTEWDALGNSYVIPQDDFLSPTYKMDLTAHSEEPQNTMFMNGQPVDSMQITDPEGHSFIVTDPNQMSMIINGNMEIPQNHDLGSGSMNIPQSESLGGSMNITPSEQLGGSMDIPQNHDMPSGGMDIHPSESLGGSMGIGGDSNIFGSMDIPQSHDMPSSMGGSISGGSLGGYTISMAMQNGSTMDIKPNELPSSNFEVKDYTAPSWEKNESSGSMDIKPSESITGGMEIKPSDSMSGGMNITPSESIGGSMDIPQSGGQPNNMSILNESDFGNTLADGHLGTFATVSTDDVASGMSNSGNQNSVYDIDMNIGDSVGGDFHSQMQTLENAFDVNIEQSGTQGEYDVQDRLNNEIDEKAYGYEYGQFKDEYGSEVAEEKDLAKDIDFKQAQNDTENAITPYNNPEEVVGAEPYCLMDLDIQAPLSIRDSHIGAMLTQRAEFSLQRLEMKAMQSSEIGRGVIKAYRTIGIIHGLVKGHRADRKAQALEKAFLRKLDAQPAAIKHTVALSKRKVKPFDKGLRTQYDIGKARRNLQANLANNSVNIKGNLDKLTDRDYKKLLEKSTKIYGDDTIVARLKNGGREGITFAARMGLDPREVKKFYKDGAWDDKGLLKYVRTSDKYERIRTNIGANHTVTEELSLLKDSSEYNKLLRDKRKANQQIKRGIRSMTMNVFKDCELVQGYYQLMPYIRWAKRGINFARKRGKALAKPIDKLIDKHIKQPVKVAVKNKITDTRLKAKAKRSAARTRKQTERLRKNSRKAFDKINAKSRNLPSRFLNGKSKTAKRFRKFQKAGQFKPTTLGGHVRNLISKIMAKIMALIAKLVASIMSSIGAMILTPAFLGGAGVFIIIAAILSIFDFFPSFDSHSALADGKTVIEARVADLDEYNQVWIDAIKSDVYDAAKSVSGASVEVDVYNGEEYDDIAEINGKTFNPSNLRASNLIKKKNGKVMGYNNTKEIIAAATLYGGECDYWNDDEEDEEAMQKFCKQLYNHSHAYKVVTEGDIIHVYACIVGNKVINGNIKGSDKWAFKNSIMDIDNYYYAKYREEQGLPPVTAEKGEAFDVTPEELDDMADEKEESENDLDEDDIDEDDDVEEEEEDDTDNDSVDEVSSIDDELGLFTVAYATTPEPSASTNPAVADAIAKADKKAKLSSPKPAATIKPTGVPATAATPEPTNPVKKVNCTLTGTMKERADGVYKVALELYPKYGILPSFIIAQAIKETNLGTAKTSAFNTHHNMFGIKFYSSSINPKNPNTSYQVFDTYQDGARGYITHVISKPRYNVNFITDPNEYIGRVLDGGYCENQARGGSYHRDWINIRNDNGLQYYDWCMFKDGVNINDYKHSDFDFSIVEADAFGGSFTGGVEWEPEPDEYNTDKWKGYIEGDHWDFYVSQLEEKYKQSYKIKEPDHWFDLSSECDDVVCSVEASSGQFIGELAGDAKDTVNSIAKSVSKAIKKCRKSSGGKGYSSLSKDEKVNAVGIHRWNLIKTGASIIGYVYYSQASGRERQVVRTDSHDYFDNQLQWTDCSGFTSWTYSTAGYKDVGYGLSTVEFSQEFPSVFTEITRDELKIGDIGINFIDRNSNRGGTNHVGIYLGKYKGQDIWMHCTNRSSPPLAGRKLNSVCRNWSNSSYKYSGPQITVGGVNFTQFGRYHTFDKLDKEYEKDPKTYEELYPEEFPEENKPSPTPKPTASPSTTPKPKPTISAAPTLAPRRG